MNVKHIACSLLAVTLAAGSAHAAKPVHLNGGGSSLAYPPYTTDFAQYTAAKSADTFSYAAAGSGAGQNAFLNNDITYFEPSTGSTSHGYAPGTLTYGTISGTEVDFGASDAFLSSTQLTNPATGSYAQSAVDGPLIQIPTLGTPITLPFNESGVGSSGLLLSDSQVCGVLSGKITDWHSLVPSIAAGTVINVVYRGDSSGTTFLLTQHLNAVCNSSNSNFSIPVPITKTFASEFTTVPSNFTAESGSGGVAKQLVATSDSFGYLSPDYTSIAPKSPNTTSLQVASLTNAVDGKPYSPTTANTTLGLANPGTGSTNGSPPASMAAAQNPLNWVPALPQTTKGYPIVGYTTIDVSSCYASSTRGKLMIAVLKDILKKTGAFATNVTNDGFVPLANSGAAKFYTAVSDTFLSNKAGYNLDIDDTKTCAGLAGR
jgi:ABC-type phosphate transport system substrate-binding protein